MTSNSEYIDRRSRTSRFLRGAAILVPIIGFGLLNVILFLKPDWLIPDEKSLKIGLYSLDPAYWPGWISWLFWLPTIGLALYAILLSPRFQARLRSYDTALFRDGAPLMESRPAWLRFTEKRPLECFLTDIAATAERGIRLFFRPIRWPSLICGLFFLAAFMVVLVQTDWGRLLIGRIIRNILFLPHYPFWTILHLYYYPLCDFFCYGTVSLKLLVVFGAVFPTVLFLSVQSQKLARSPRRDEHTELVLHYLLVAVLLTVFFWIGSHLGTLSTWAARVLLLIVLVIWSFLRSPGLCATRYYESLCNLFAYGTGSCMLIMTVIVGILAICLLFRFSRSVAVTARFADMDKPLRRIAVSAGAVFTVLLFLAYRHTFFSYILAGDIGFPQIDRFREWPVAVYMDGLFVPLCLLWGYGIVTVRLALVAILAILSMAVIYWTARSIAASENRRLRTRQVLYGCLFGTVFILLGLGIWNFPAVQTSLVSLAVFLTELPHALGTDLFYDHLCDLMCYGTISWKLVCMSAIGIVSIVAIGWSGRSLAHGENLRRVSLVLFVGSLFVSFLVLSIYRQPIGEGLGICADRLIRTPNDFVFLPYCGLFCYGLLSWKLAATWGFAVFVLVAVLKTSRRIARSDHERQMEKRIRDFVVGAVFCAAFVSCFLAVSFLPALLDKGVGRSVLTAYDRFFRFPLNDLFCYGLGSRSLTVVTILLLAFAVWLYRSGRRSVDAPKASQRRFLLCLCALHLLIATLLLLHFRDFLVGSCLALAALPGGVIPWMVYVPLCNLFCYGNIPFPLLLLLSILISVLAFLWRTDKRRFYPRQGVVVGAACLAVLGSALALLAVLHPWWSHWLDGSAFDRYYGYLCDFFCYGAYGGLLARMVCVAVLPLLTLVVLTRYAAAAKTNRARTALLGTLLGFVATSFVLCQNALIRNTEFLSESFVRWKEINLTLPLYGWFCYGTVTWNILGMLFLPALGVLLTVCSARITMRWSDRIASAPFFACLFIAAVLFALLMNVEIITGIPHVLAVSFIHRFESAYYIPLVAFMYDGSLTAPFVAVLCTTAIAIFLFLRFLLQPKPRTGRS